MMALILALVLFPVLTAARAPVRLPDAPPWPKLQATPTMGYNGWLSATMGHEPGAKNQTLYCACFFVSHCLLFFFFFKIIIKYSRMYYRLFIHGTHCMLLRTQPRTI